jgi:hypothetical protein
MSLPRFARLAAFHLRLSGFLLAAGGLALLVGAKTGRAETAPPVRPLIWVTPADRDAILQKIETQPWARQQFDALKKRSREALAAHQRDPASYLRGLPWRETGKGIHPTLARIDANMASTDRADAQTALQAMLGQGIDCAVLFYLTGEEPYARLAADVLQALVRAWRVLPVSTDTGNGGWLYTNDHLYEARAIGAQLPVLYDFLAAYVRRPDVTVLDLPTGRRVPFAQADAQEVFRTYARLAVEHGMSNSNWPTLEMPSLTHNALALDDASERVHWLEFVTHRDAERQDPLSKVVAEFHHAGGVWPESIQYSSGVAGNVTYVVALLRRQSLALPLPGDIAAIPRSLSRLRDFRFPNGEYVRFGDGPRRAGDPYHSWEIAYAMAWRAGDAAAQAEFGGLLREALEAGRHDRSRLGPPLAGAGVYLSPLALLWFAPEIVEPATRVPAPTVTDQLPFAGLVLQRNLAPDGEPRHALMAAVSGASYVHSHASGMALELYGLGAVLGANAGKGRYTTEEHENYRRLFAAANTVIVNGAARSAGGWVGLGMEPVRLQSLEPAVGAAPVSPHHSFFLTRHRQNHGAAQPAEQERLVGLVRVSPTQGFYVDVYRSRTAAGEPGQFHDYLYHNVANGVRVSTAAGPLALADQPDRFKAVPGSTWRRNGSYLYPGWHTFRQVRASTPTDADVVAQFTARDLKPQAGGMRVHLFGESGREYAVAAAPETKEAPAGYEKKATPVLVVRQPGEAWDRPFAAVYEPRVEGASGGIMRTAVLRQDGRFAGMAARCALADGTLRNYFILIPPDPEQGFAGEEWGLRFRGRYAVVVTDGSGGPREMYVGEGTRLEYRGAVLGTESGENFSAWAEWRQDGPVLVTRSTAKLQLP